MLETINYANILLDHSAQQIAYDFKYMRSDSETPELRKMFEKNEKAEEFSLDSIQQSDISLAKIRSVQIISFQIQIIFRKLTEDLGVRMSAPSHGSSR
ncbi:unnamed protein product [Dracunculus medinensis]|uniref:Uncharacterized protein n=1 Tax=Dracunculus medinensis TaxID=318479 RepID=A0A0N4UKF4_DRAME|nr:unnamed protein product [Dracunculus medinensis]